MTERAAARYVERLYQDRCLQKAQPVLQKQDFLLYAAHLLARLFHVEQWLGLKTIRNSKMQFSYRPTYLLVYERKGFPAMTPVFGESKTHREVDRPRIEYQTPGVLLDCLTKA